jgi:glyceraldehyde-3-phosphate dehydrogenase (NAD(P))
MSKVKVAINGYGTIGKRVADAVSLQDDMEVLGVTKTKPTFEARLANDKGYPLYGISKESVKSFEEAGLKTEGVFDSLLEQADIIVDCTPGKVGAKNKEDLYIPKKLKAIYQGGEKASVGETSFVAQINYNSSIGKDHVRVVSCNTTGLSRAIGALSSNFSIGTVRAFLVRRSADPRDSSKGPINAIIPDPLTVPSHHGPDIQTILPDLKVITSAVKVPTTLMHLHSLMVELKDDASESDVKNVLEQARRTKVLHSKEGFRSTAEVIEYARDLGRSRYDLYENMIWEDSIVVKDKEAYFFQGIAQESIVVPENIDAIRAVLELETDAEKSMDKTDKTLSI